MSVGNPGFTAVEPGGPTIIPCLLLRCFGQTLALRRKDTKASITEVAKRESSSPVCLLSLWSLSLFCTTGGCTPVIDNQGVSVVWPLALHPLRQQEFRLWLGYLGRDRLNCRGIFISLRDSLRDSLEESAFRADFELGSVSSLCCFLGKLTALPASSCVRQMETPPLTSGPQVERPRPVSCCCCCYHEAARISPYSVPTPGEGIQT